MNAPGHASPFADLARKRDLWWQFTIRTIELRHRGSYLGIIWAGLTPLLMLALYYVVFGKIFAGSFGVLPDETRTDYALAFFLGLILHQLTAETLSLAPGVILANPNLVKKVVFPLDILPVAQLGATWFNLIISLGLMLIGAVTLGRGVTVAGLLWLPVILLPLLLLTAGLGWLFSAVGVFFRDLGQIMPFIAQVVLYASAVVYPIAKIPPEIWMFLKWNPLLHSVELARDALVWNTPLNLTHLGYTYVVGTAVFLGGRWIFLRLQSAFADVI
jgi:lipopolysaccharide transport system permease protein